MRLNDELTLSFIGELKKDVSFERIKSIQVDYKELGEYNGDMPRPVFKVEYYDLKK